MTDIGETTYSISKLAEAAVTTPRTIRYYAAEGLLPPPRSEGRYAVYNDAHLLRLRLIQKLKNAYLPLGTIREQIADLTDAEVEMLLGNDDTAAKAPQEEGAKPRLRPSVYLTKPNTGQSGFDFIKQILAVTGQNPPTETSVTTDKPKRALLISPIFRPESELKDEAAAIIEAESDTPSNQASAIGESWTRILIAPGIELNLRQPVTSETRALVAIIQNLFQGNKNTDEKGNEV